MLLQQGQLFFIDKNFQLARLLEIQQTGQISAGAQAAFTTAAQIGGRAGQQRTAQTITDGIDTALAGGLFNRVQGGQNTFAQIIREIFIRLFRARIDPGNNKNRKALIHPPFDQ